MQNNFYDQNDQVIPFPPTRGLVTSDILKGLVGFLGLVRVGWMVCKYDLKMANLL